MRDVTLRAKGEKSSSRPLFAEWFASEVTGRLVKINHRFLVKGVTSP